MQLRMEAGDRVPLLTATFKHISLKSLTVSNFSCMKDFGSPAYCTVLNGVQQMLCSKTTVSAKTR